MIVVITLAGSQDSQVHQRPRISAFISCVFMRMHARNRNMSQSSEPNPLERAPSCQHKAKMKWRAFNSTFVEVKGAREASWTTVTPVQEKATEPWQAVPLDCNLFSMLLMLTLLQGDFWKHPKRSTAEWNLLASPEGRKGPWKLSQDSKAKGDMELYEKTCSQGLYVLGSNC